MRIKSKNKKKGIMLPNSVYLRGINLFYTSGSYYDDYSAGYVLDLLCLEFNVEVNDEDDYLIDLYSTAQTYKDITNELR